LKAAEKMLANAALNQSKSIVKLQPAQFSTCKSLLQESNPPASQSAGGKGNSPAADMFFVEHVKDKSYAILRLNRAPVNSLNLDFLTQLNIQLDKFEQSNDINGVILTSQIANIFSAGLDILEMYQIKADRGRQFWSTLQEFWIKLYGSSKIYIAAINGHSPAGGCLAAMSCDYRIMVKGPYKIGLNETQLVNSSLFFFQLKTY
jgi:hypothetical protein